MNDLLISAADRAARYLASLDTRRVFPPAEAIDDLHQFDEPLPDDSTDPETVLALLDEVGSPATVASAGRDD